MSFLASYAKYVQTKLGFYDKQLGEYSLEQRILEGIEVDDVRDQRTFLIDVDVVRGSVFSKNKPRHGWTQAFFWGTLRSAFAPFHWKYWSKHLSPSWAVYVLFHYALQFIQVLCFLLIDPDSSRASQDDVIVPFLLAIGLGILHTRITSAHVGATHQSGEADLRHTAANPEFSEHIRALIPGLRRSSCESDNAARRHECDDAKSFAFKEFFARTETQAAELRNRHAPVHQNPTTTRKVRSPTALVFSRMNNVLLKPVSLVPTLQIPADEFLLNEPNEKKRHVNVRMNKEQMNFLREDGFSRRLNKPLHEGSVDVANPIATAMQDGSAESIQNIHRYKPSPNELAKLKRASAVNLQPSTSGTDDAKAEKLFIVSPYATAQAVIQQPFQPTPEVPRRRSSTVHFPINYSHSVDNGKLLPSIQFYTLRHWYSCSNLNEFAMSPRLTVSGRWRPLPKTLLGGKSHVLHSSDPSMSSGTSISSALSNLHTDDKKWTDRSSGCNPAHTLRHGRPVMSTNPVQSHPVQTTFPAESVCTLPTNPNNQREPCCFGPIRSRPMMTSNSMLNLTNQQMSVLPVLDGLTAYSLPTESIPTDSTVDCPVDPHLYLPRGNDNYPETKSSISPHRCTTFPPNKSRRPIITDPYAAAGAAAAPDKVTTHSNTSMLRCWSPESDTEQDVVMISQAYSNINSARTRRSVDLSNAANGRHISKPYRLVPPKIRQLSRRGGRITSETECDRIDSDVGSNVLSSSGPEDLGPLPGKPAVNFTCEPQDRLFAWSAKKKRSTGKHRSFNKRIRRQSDRVTTIRHVTKTQVPEMAEERSDSTDTEPTADDAWADEEPASYSEHESAEETHPLQPDVSLSNAEDGSRSAKMEYHPAGSGWIDDGHVPSGGRAQAPVKLLNKTSMQEPLSKSASNQTSSLMDTVRCFVSGGESNFKINLTVLDIGYIINRAVERQGISADYIILAFAVTLLLPLLSVAFHWAHIVPASVNISTASNNETAGFFSLGVAVNTNSPVLVPAAWVDQLGDSLFAVHLRVLLSVGERLVLTISQLWAMFSPAASISRIQYVLQGQWIQAVNSTDLADRLVIVLGFLLRFNVYGTILFLLCIAEMTFQQRLLYAKYFFSITSARRARKYRVPQFRLNKLGHIKCWLTLRSYLKKRGPQRTVETVIAAAFYIVFFFGLGLCSQLISRREQSVFSHLTNWDILGLTMAIMLFLHRLIILGTKITKKYRNFSVLITEQINLYLSMEKKPQKKEELMATFQVLRLVEGLLKEVDGPFRVCGWTVNPLVYNIFKLVLLSCFSSLLSETLGFKLKLYKLKLNAANW